MYKISQLTKEAYKVREVAEILDVTTKSIRNFDADGRLKTFRTESNHRMVAKEDLIEYMTKNNMLSFEEDDKRDVIYARVSSHDQKKGGDLDRQALYLVENAKTLTQPIILKEVGSGLNDKRPELLKLIRMVCNNEIKNVYITYKDRLTRFGFNYLKTMFEAHGVKIIVVQDKAARKDVKDELVEDLMSLIASFSGKLYGMRSKKNKVEKKK